MPSYDFTCSEHGTFQVFENFSFEGGLEHAACPYCGKESPRNWKTSTGRPPPPFHAYITEAFKGGPHYVKDKEHEKHLLGSDFVRLK